MRIDPLLSLAVSMDSNKGVYALLLGSGVSRAASIPTGYEVIVELITRLAKLSNADCVSPLLWFKETYKSEPDYTLILSQLAQTPPERRNLLKPFFEPSGEEQREHGIKMPTAAHRAIAELMATGYVRVVITTNFDRLLEQALQKLGIEPQVISTPDAAAAAIPLIHAGPTIVKVNGDYLDTRLLNTEAELSAYDPRMNGLLDRIFDEFGVIVCGWSADWDMALRSTIERCPSRRFTTFWTSRGDPALSAQSLISSRRAVLINIIDADRFFQDLRDKIFALRDSETAPPQSKAVAVATVKRYLVDPAARIRLSDLVKSETEELHARLYSGRFGLTGNLTPDQLDKRADLYENFGEVLGAMLATGAYWGAADAEALWTGSVRRIANPETLLAAWTDTLLALSLYPILLLTYTVGICALATKNYRLFRAVTHLKGHMGQQHDEPLFMFNPWVVLEYMQKVTPQSRLRFADSDRVCNAIRSYTVDIYVGNADFSRDFNRLEYLLSLLGHDRQLQSGSNFSYAYVGRFARDYRSVKAWVTSESEKRQDEWFERLRLFGGKPDRLQTAISSLESFAK